MAEMNGQFSDDRAVEIVGDDNPDPKVSDLMVKVAALEQENLQLVHEKDVIEKKIGELKKTIEEAGIEKEKLLGELQKSKGDIKTLESVAARASDLEGEVSRLQHDLISTTSELQEVNGELNEMKSTLDGLKKKDGEKQKEFEAIVVERDLLIEKLVKMEAKENQYLSEMNEKETVIMSLRVKVEDTKKEGDNWKKVAEAKIGELERKLKITEKVIDGFEEKEKETTVLEGKPCGLMAGEINVGWQVVAGSALGIGLVGLVFYLHQAKRT